MIVFLNIDEVIRVIREADDPKADLMSTFNLSERQSEDILEIRLRQLARLEAIKIEQELKELRSEKEKLEECAEQRRVDETPAPSRNRSRRQTVRRRSPHADPAEKRATFEVRVIDEPGDGGGVAEGLGACAKGPRPRPGELPVQGRRRPLRRVLARTPDVMIAWGSNGRV